MCFHNNSKKPLGFQFKSECFVFAGLETKPEQQIKKRLSFFSNTKPIFPSKTSTHTRNQPPPHSTHFFHRKIPVHRSVFTAEARRGGQPGVTAALSAAALPQDMVPHVRQGCRPAQGTN